MRLLAGLKVTRADLTGMGVGGLLMEIVTRPQPRVPEHPGDKQNIAAVILAAGRSTRMGGPNKLLAEIGGKSLVRIVAEQALASRASSVIVVTGHQAADVEKALRGLKVDLVYNPDFVDGLASSVKAGIAAVPIIILIVIFVSLRDHVFFDLQPRRWRSRTRARRAFRSAFRWVASRCSCRRVRSHRSDPQAPRENPRRIPDSRCERARSLGRRCTRRRRELDAVDRRRAQQALVRDRDDSSTTVS